MTKIVAFLVAFLSAGCILAAENMVTVGRSGNRDVLLINQKPFLIKGVTYSGDDSATKMERDYQELKSLGVTAVRNWGLSINSDAYLDLAEKCGIKVVAGLWLMHGRPGNDGGDRFDWINDAAGKEKQRQDTLAIVRKYKNHPALLMWGLGNEVILNIATEEEKVAYAKFFGALVKEIKAIDPNHPVTSASAWVLSCPYWKKYAPDLDVYGLNIYGAGSVGAVIDTLAKDGYTKPYVLLEFGASIEGNPTDQQKYEDIVAGYQEKIAPTPNCLGSFIFHYADVPVDYVALRLAARVDGCKRATYNAIQKAYAGRDPVNQIPQITQFVKESTVAGRGEWIPVALKVTDKEGDKLEVQFYAHANKGDWKEWRSMRAIESRGSLATGYQVHLPDKTGQLWIFVTVKDSAGNMASENVEVLIKEPQELEMGRRPGKPVTPPCYVYKDEGSPENHYIPSGYMGDLSAASIDRKYVDPGQQDKTCIKIDYKKADSWFGLAWLDPANDFGEQYGGYDLTGAKKFTFLARGENGEEMINVGFGLIGKDKTWYDSASKATGEFKLTKEWKRYELDLSGLDLTRIKSGLRFFLGGKGNPYTVYLDDVKFE